MEVIYERNEELIKDNETVNERYGWDVVSEYKQEIISKWKQKYYLRD